MNIVENFKNYRLDIKGQSLGTVKGYLSDLGLFFKYMDLDMNNLTIEQLKNITENNLNSFIVLLIFENGMTSAFEKTAESKIKTDRKKIPRNSAFLTIFS